MIPESSSERKKSEILQILFLHFICTSLIFFFLHLFVKLSLASMFIGDHEANGMLSFGTTSFVSIN